MTRFTKCMFCAVSNKEDHAHGKLQAATLLEINSLQKSIENRIGTLEAKIKKRTSARSGGASHQQAGSTTEDLRLERSSLRDLVFRELDRFWSKVARFIPQRNESAAVPRGNAQDKLDLQRNALDACFSGWDDETLIEDAWV